MKVAHWLAMTFLAALAISLLILLCGCELASRYDQGANDAEVAKKKTELSDLKAAIELDAKQGIVDPQKLIALTQKLEEVRQLAEQHSGKWYDPFLYLLGGVIGYPIARIGRRIPLLGQILAMGDPNKKNIPPPAKT